MSSAYVRNLVRQWVGTLTTPFVETINVEQNPQNDLWMTVQFDQTGWDKLTYCDHFLEAGVITLSWLGKPGIGDADIIAAAEIDAALFMAKADPAHKLVITGRSAPDDFEGVGVPTLQVDITFNYSYSI